MKYLTVVRHAKSSWDHPGLADHDRPLNARGQRAAPAVAAFLNKTYFGDDGAEEALLPAPDRLVTSTAARALATAQVFRETFKLPIETLLLDSRLYLASDVTILNLVQALDESWGHAMIFGHNPGFHEFCDHMLARANVQRMPTCTAVLLGLPIEHWALADWNEAQLVGLVTPKLLEKRFPSIYTDIARPDEP
jgi:phosphohistidine phosphatase